jgi:hypothetical protein
MDGGQADPARSRSQTELGLVSKADGNLLRERPGVD